MKPELTVNQRRVLERIDELLKYAESCGLNMQQIGLSDSQFKEFKTIEHKKLVYPDKHKSLDIRNGIYRGVLMYQHQEKKVLVQQQLSLREA